MIPTWSKVSRLWLFLLMFGSMGLGFWIATGFSNIIALLVGFIATQWALWCMRERKRLPDD